MLQQTLGTLLFFSSILISLGGHPFFDYPDPYYYHDHHRGFSGRAETFNTFTETYPWGNGRRTTRRPTTSFSTTTAQTPLYQSCLRNCPATPQYDPVCGSNGQSYNNRYALNCASRCGVGVRLARLGLCVPRGR